MFPKTVVIKNPDKFYRLYEKERAIYNTLFDKIEQRKNNIKKYKIKYSKSKNRTFINLIDLETEYININLVESLGSLLRIERIKNDYFMRLLNMAGVKIKLCKNPYCKIMFPTANIKTQFHSIKCERQHTARQHRIRKHRQDEARQNATA